MRSPDDRQATGQAPDRMVTVQEAAILLGLSEDAVRSRLKRGSLAKEKAPDGTVLVVLGADGGADRPGPANDQPTTGQPTDQATALIEALYDQVTHLREQLAEEREARRRADTIIAQLTQANDALARRVPELETATEPRESPMSASKDSSNIRLTEEEQRSWWRRFFGF